MVVLEAVKLLFESLLSAKRPDTRQSIQSYAHVIVNRAPGYQCLIVNKKMNLVKWLS